MAHDGRGRDTAAAGAHSKYCHRCGFEYVPAMTVCSECGEPLVDEPLPAPPPAPLRVHATAEVSIAALGAEDRSFLDLLLRGGEIRTVWTDTVVVVPADRAAEVEDLIDSLEHPPGATADPVPPTRITTVAGTLRRDPAAAARWQRLVGSFLDATLLGCVGGILAQLGASWWVVPSLAAAYEIACVAVFGATIGKVVVGARVVAAGGTRPSWWASFLRWLLVGWIGFAAAIGSSVVDSVALITIVATYAPVLWDPQGRGLHDRLAGTIVARRGR